MTKREQNNPPPPSQPPSPPPKSEPGVWVFLPFGTDVPDINWWRIAAAEFLHGTDWPQIRWRAAKELIAALDKASPKQP